MLSRANARWTAQTAVNRSEKQSTDYHSLQSGRMAIGVETALGTINLPSPFDPFNPYSQLLEPSRAAVAVRARAARFKALTILDTD